MEPILNLELALNIDRRIRIRDMLGQRCPWTLHCPHGHGGHGQEVLWTWMNNKTYFCPWPMDTYGQWTIHGHVLNVSIDIQGRQLGNLG